jgi:hypothetical protein
MTLFLASYVYLAPGHLEKLNLVTYDDMGCLSAIEPFTQETPRTTFHEGIITAPLVLKPFLLPPFATSVTPAQLIEVLKRQMEQHPDWTFLQCLDQCTQSTGLVCGMKTALWCIHGVQPFDKNPSGQFYLEQLFSNG